MWGRNYKTMGRQSESIIYNSYSLFIYIKANSIAHWPRTCVITMVLHFLFSLRAHLILGLATLNHLWFPNNQCFQLWVFTNTISSSRNAFPWGVCLTNTYSPFKTRQRQHLSFPVFLDPPPSTINLSPLPLFLHYSQY